MDPPPVWWTLLEFRCRSTRQIRGEVIPPGVEIQRPEAHCALERSAVRHPYARVGINALGYSWALTVKASAESVVTTAQHPICVRSGVTAVTSPTEDRS